MAEGRGQALTPRGEIEVDQRGQTSMPGIFAAGERQRRPTSRSSSPWATAPRPRFRPSTFDPHGAGRRVRGRLKRRRLSQPAGADGGERIATGDPRKADAAAACKTLDPAAEFLPVRTYLSLGDKRMIATRPHQPVAGRQRHFVRVGLLDPPTPGNSLPALMVFSGRGKKWKTPLVPSARDHKMNPGLPLAATIGASPFALHAGGGPKPRLRS